MSVCDVVSVKEILAAYLREHQADGFTTLPGSADSRLRISLRDTGYYSLDDLDTDTWGGELWAARECKCSDCDAESCSLRGSSSCVDGCVIPCTDESVTEFVARWLRDHGYDGLVMPEEWCGEPCSCDLDDLMPCDWGFDCLARRRP